MPKVKNPGPPPCHPERRYHAKGMCQPCYQKAYDDARSERRKLEGRKRPEDYAPNYRKPPIKAARIPECHPDRPHAGRGFCGPCYQQAKKRGDFVVGMATCHPDQPEQARGLCYRCYSKKQYWDNPEASREVQRKYNRALRERHRAEMLEAYGGECACPRCPETNPAFLCLDHVNGDGKAHRLRVGSHTYSDLRRQGWPKDGYRLLCWNCNSATRFGRTCPHEENHEPELDLSP